MGNFLFLFLGRYCWQANCKTKFLWRKTHWNKMFGILAGRTCTKFGSYVSWSRRPWYFQEKRLFATRWFTCASTFLERVHEYLDAVFRDRWIGGRILIKWTCRCSNFTPLDYILWSYLKSKVFKTKLANVNESKAQIRHECRLIPHTLIPVFENCLKKVQ